MDNSTLNLDSQLCFKTYTASRLTIRLYKPLLDKIKLTYPQYVAMLVLWEEKEIGFRNLSKKLFMQTGTLTPIIQRLEKLGYVKKIKDPNDERRAIVVLTDSGESLIPEASQIPYKLAETLGLTKNEYLNYVNTMDEFLETLLKADLTNL